MKPILVLLHGFNSSSKPTGMVEDLSVQFDVVQLSYDTFDTYHNIKHILLDQCQKIKPAFIAGSSLGGFFAIDIAQEVGINSIAFNPVLEPVSTLTKLMGDHTNFITLERNTLTQNTVDSYRGKDIGCKTVTYPTDIYIDLSDELINAWDTIAIMRSCADVTTFVSDGAGHRFRYITDAMPSIIKFKDRCELLGVSNE